MNQEYFSTANCYFTYSPRLATCSGVDYYPTQQFIAPRILKCEYCGTQSYCKDAHGKAFRCESCGAPLNAGAK